MARPPDDGIRVTVIHQKDRNRLLLRYIDPATGKRQFRTAKGATKKDALKEAGAWEDELRTGRYAPPSKTTWEAFRDRYEREHLESLADKTAMKVATVFDAVERIISPRLLRDLTAERLSAFQSKLREEHRAETTIAGYMSHLGAALRWAAGLGLVREAPKITRPKRAKQQKVMKGRPITGEEFERMLKATRAVVGKGKAKAWRWYQLGLYWSGLRLAESLELYWDRDDKLCVDLSGRRPMLRIPAALEKGNQDRVLPMAPEFARLLLRVPEHKRRGRVFKIEPQLTGRSDSIAPLTVTRTIGEIGRKAGVKVATVRRMVKVDGKRTVQEVVKYASAHDLRRSFGERWAKLVMPQVLMELMRHESIETTLRYYVGRNAQKTADVLWQAFEQKASGNNFGNKPKKPVSDAHSTDAANSDTAST